MAGKVQGAIKPQVDEANFGLTSVVAGSHIRTVGKDLEPIDLSNEENVNAFMKDMADWRDTVPVSWFLPIRYRVVGETTWGSSRLNPHLINNIKTHL